MSSFPPTLSQARLAALLLACSCVLFPAASETIPADSPLINWAGRVLKDGSGAVRFDWVGAGAVVAYSGSWLSVTVNVTETRRPFKLAAFEDNQGWMYPESINWVLPSRSNASTGLLEVLVASSAAPTRAVLNVPPQYWTNEGGGSPAVVVAFNTDGSFSQAPSYPRRMEFIGDSITAATNVHARPPCGDGGLQSDYSASWSSLLCDHFGANCSTIAVGGKGLVRNCCDNGLHMPDYYQRTTYSSSSPDYDFAASGFVPDAVVINLGTNDYSKPQPASFDAVFTAAYVQLMSNITRWYGSEEISFFCVVGPMSYAYANATAAAVTQAQAAGLRAHYVNVTHPVTDGCAGHPGLLGHYAMYLDSAPVIAAALGWNETRAQAVPVGHGVESFPRA